MTPDLETAVSLPALREALAGRYRVKRQLGGGGTGVVFLARPAAGKRPVALKVLRPSLAAQPETRERFLKRARAAAQVGHPNFVRIHDVGEAGGFAFIAMDYVGGATLAQVVRDWGPMWVGRATEVLRDVALGVEAANQGGVVHGNLSPENVMIEWRTRRVVVMDVGLGPEPVTGGRPDATGNVHALGVIGHFAATGALPSDREAPPPPVLTFLATLRRTAQDRSRTLEIAVMTAGMLIIGVAMRHSWIIIYTAAGLALLAYVAIRTLLPDLRFLLRDGYGREDLVRALSREAEREREGLASRYGSGWNAADRPAWRVAYAGLGVAAVGALSSFVPLVPPDAGLGAVVAGSAVAAVSGLAGLVRTRGRGVSLDLWLWFWRSKVGEWVIKWEAWWVVPRVSRPLGGAAKR